MENARQELKEQGFRHLDTLCEAILEKGGIKSYLK